MWQKYSLSCVKSPPPSLPPFIRLPPLSLIFTIFCSLSSDVVLYFSPSFLLLLSFSLPLPLPHTHTFFNFFIYPHEVSHYFPKKKILLRATFSRNAAVVSNPPRCGKHMFLCSTRSRRKLDKSLILSHVWDEAKCTFVATTVRWMHTHTHTREASLTEGCVRRLTWQPYSPFIHSLVICDVFPERSRRLMLSHRVSRSRLH